MLVLDKQTTLTYTGQANNTHVWQTNNTPQDNKTTRARQTNNSYKQHSLAEERHTLRQVDVRSDLSSCTCCSDPWLNPCSLAEGCWRPHCCQDLRFRGEYFVAGHRKEKLYKACQVELYYGGVTILWSNTVDLHSFMIVKHPWFGGKDSSLLMSHIRTLFCWIGTVKFKSIYWLKE